MAAPEISADGLWGQLGAGVAVFLAVVGAVFQQFRTGLKKGEPAQTAVLQSAEIADMRPIREAAGLLSQMIEQQRQAMTDVRDLKVMLGEIRTIVLELNKDREMNQLLDRLQRRERQDREHE